MTKKIILSSMLLLAGILHADLKTIVSIPPQKTFLKAIGGDKIDVTVMVMPGNSPHIYEPKPSQMKDIAKADLYFAIGVEFENVWLDRFKSINKSLIIIDTDKGIDKISTGKDKHGNRDQHIWLSPTNVKIISKNMYEAIAKADPTNKEYYKKRLNSFLSHIDKTDEKIRSLLKGKGKRFMVFHPSWSYFAKEYGLVQVPIEKEGKQPKPKELMILIKRAKEQNISAIFTSPEFSDEVAKQIAKELGVPVVKISPLAENWSENLIKFTESLVN